MEKIKNEVFEDECSFKQNKQHLKTTFRPPVNTASTLLYDDR